MKRRAWLCLPPVLLYATDLALTLTGQPAAYWQGDVAAVEELNPLAFWLLLQGPGVFLTVAALWGIVFVAILLFWRSAWTVVIAFVLTLGHAVGAASWLWRHGITGILGAVILLVIAERLLNWSWRQSGLKTALQKS